MLIDVNVAVARVRVWGFVEVELDAAFTSSISVCFVWPSQVVSTMTVADRGQPASRSLTAWPGSTSSVVLSARSTIVAPNFASTIAPSTVPVYVVETDVGSECVSLMYATSLDATSTAVASSDAA
jgi:hypothetical protein